MAIATVNPATGKILKTFETLSAQELERKISRAAKVFQEFSRLSFAAKRPGVQQAPAQCGTENDAEINDAAPQKRTYRNLGERGELWVKCGGYARKLSAAIAGPI